MQLIAPYNNSVVRAFLCISISAKTNRLFFTIVGPDGFEPAITNSKIFQDPDKLTNIHFLLEKACLLVRFLLSLTRR
jgi:hypothetical protein